MQSRERIAAAVWIVVQDAHVAEDIFQNTVLKAVSKELIFEADAALLSWAFITARRNALDWIHKHRRESIGFEPEVLELLEAEWQQDQTVLIPGSRSRTLRSWETRQDHTVTHETRRIMKTLTQITTLLAFAILVPLGFAAELPLEFIAASEKARAGIPLGGDLEPNPKLPVFVAVGHGGRILLSKNDGKTWEQVYFGHLGSDHGPWATKAVAYSEGVFVVPLGWGGPTSWLASEDGVNWRHLTHGEAKLSGIREAKGDPTVMPGTWGIAGGAGAFVTGGYMTMAATPDLGKSITTFSLRDFKDDPRPRKLVTHHVGPVWCGEASGRFLALGNDRSKENTVFGNLFASDDQGKTWRWLEPKLLNEECEGYSGIVATDEQVVIADKMGANLFFSTDAGESWEGPFPTGFERATMSLVGDEFWLVSSKGARATRDGKTWRVLPERIPVGKIVSSPENTLINIERRRCSILRSEDGGKTWDEVFAYEEPKSEHIHGAQGLRDIAFGYVNETPIR